MIQGSAMKGMLYGDLDRQEQGDKVSYRRKYGVRPKRPDMSFNVVIFICH